MISKFWLHKDLPSLIKYNRKIISLPTFINLSNRCYIKKFLKNGLKPSRHLLAQGHERRTPKQSEKLVQKNL